MVVIENATLVKFMYIEINLTFWALSPSNNIASTHIPWRLSHHKKSGNLCFAISAPIKTPSGTQFECVTFLAESHLKLWYAELNCNEIRFCEFFLVNPCYWIHGELSPLNWYLALFSKFPMFKNQSYKLSSIGFSRKTCRLFQSSEFLIY